MTHQDHLKVELMVFAIKHDFFGYGSQIWKRKDGKYVCIVDGERSVCTCKDLISDFDTIDGYILEDIMNYYLEKELAH